MKPPQLCPKFEAAFRLLGKRWSGPIIQVMLSGPKRFKELSEAISGVSDRVLTERLKELEEAGILVRRVYPETPVRIEYELTEKGYDLREVMQATQRWGETWF